MAGSTDAGAFCDLVSNFSDEPDVAVWRTITAGLGWCDRLLDGEPRRRRAFVRQLVGPRLAELGWQAEPGEDDLVGELRGLLIRTMAVMGDDRATQERAAEVLDGHLRDGEAVDLPVVAAVVAVAAASEGAPSSSSSVSARPTPRRTSCGTSTHWPTSTTRP